MSNTLPMNNYDRCEKYYKQSNTTKLSPKQRRRHFKKINVMYYRYGISV